MNCLYCDEPIPPKRQAVLRAWGKEPICLRCAEDTVQPVVASENPADDTGTDFAIVLGHLRRPGFLTPMPHHADIMDSSNAGTRRR